MRRHLGTLLLVPLLLTGCGSTDDDSARDLGPADDDTSTSTTTAPAPDPSPAADLVYDVTIVSATSSGGRMAPTLTPLPDKKAVDRFVRQFRIDSFGDEVREAITTARAGDVDMYGGVVAISCDAAPGATVTRYGDDLVATAVEVSSPLPECFAPVISVAVVSVAS